LPSKDGKLNLVLLILTLMFGITIIVRLPYLDNIQFLEDEAAALILFYQNIHHGPVLVGLQSSTGLYNPPCLFICCHRQISKNNFPLAYYRIVE